MKLSCLYPSIPSTSARNPTAARHRPCHVQSTISAHSWSATAWSRNVRACLSGWVLRAGDRKGREAGRQGLRQSGLGCQGGQSWDLTDCTRPSFQQATSACDAAAARRRHYCTWSAVLKHPPGQLRPVHPACRHQDGCVCMQAAGKAEKQVDKAGKQVDKASNNGTSDSVVGAAAVARSRVPQRTTDVCCTCMFAELCCDRNLETCMTLTSLASPFVLQGDAAQEAQQKVRSHSWCPI